MARRRSGVAHRVPSHAYFRLHDSELLELVFVGHINDLTLENASGLPARVGRRTLLFDCERMTDLASEARAPTIRLFKILRERGIERLCCVAPSAAQRIAVAALAFVAGLELELFGDRRRAFLTCS
jgi:hypothetical protein